MPSDSSQPADVSISDADCLTPSGFPKVFPLAITIAYSQGPGMLLMLGRQMSMASVCYNTGIMKENQRPYQERIIADPRILAGKPVVKGTRIAVDLVLEELAHNPDIEELLAAHPDLTRTDVQACLAYAKALATGEEVSPKPPKGIRSDAAL